ncbi:MAG: UTRA domain-containing protein [Alphaproteobacteria bacterium]|jgi:GntR family transcriptional regulator|nr:UTRA domain-containing protein [Alphaproteobacteria bacterium]
MTASFEANPGRLPDDDPAPRYARLAGLIADRIASGDLPPGSALPPERRIAELYGLSRVTVRRALEQLAAEGLIEQRRGSGTFVSQRVRQPLSILTSFSDDVRARGMEPGARTLDAGIAVATSEEAIGLGLRPGERVSRVTRLRSANGIPLALEITAVVADALPDPSAVAGSLYDLLGERGLRPVRALQRLSAVALDRHEADLLEVPPGSPGLNIVRVGYAADGRPVEYTRSKFRGDRWDFFTELV